MKALLISTMIIAGSLVASTGYSQVYVRAHVNLGIPAPRVYCAPAPAPVAYEDGYAPDPYADAPVVVDEPYAASYTYPAWNGHYRDRFYFDHYRPFFERDHARFDRGHERFDRDRGRFDGDRGRDFNRGYQDRERDFNRGYQDRGRNFDRGYQDRGRNSDRNYDHERR